MRDERDLIVACMDDVEWRHRKHGELHLANKCECARNSFLRALRELEDLQNWHADTAWMDD
jgi:hypothetical protein